MVLQDSGWWLPREKWLQGLLPAPHSQMLPQQGETETESKGLQAEFSQKYFNITEFIFKAPVLVKYYCPRLIDAKNKPQKNNKWPTPQNNPFDFCNQLQKLLGWIWESLSSWTTICSEKETHGLHSIYKNLVQAKVRLNSLTFWKSVSKKGNSCWGWHLSA